MYTGSAEGRKGSKNTLNGRYEEFEKAHEVLTFTVHITEVDLDETGEIVEIEEEPEGNTVHCHIV